MAARTPASSSSRGNGEESYQRAGSPVDIQIQSGSPTSANADVPVGDSVSMQRVPPIRNVSVKNKSKVRRRRARRVDTSKPGNIVGKIRMMRDSRNLRFRDLHHPPDPTVVIIFVLFVGFLTFFHLYLRPKFFSNENVRRSYTEHSDL